MELPNLRENTEHTFLKVIRNGLRHRDGGNSEIIIRKNLRMYKPSTIRIVIRKGRRILFENFMFSLKSKRIKKRLENEFTMMPSPPSRITPRVGPISQG